MKTILERLAQESTWRGIITVIGAFGVAVSPELANHIIAGALAIVGIINIAKKD